MDEYVRKALSQETLAQYEGKYQCNLESNAEISPTQAGSSHAELPQIMPCSVYIKRPVKPGPLLKKKKIKLTPPGENKENIEPLIVEKSNESSKTNKEETKRIPKIISNVRGHFISADKIHNVSDNTKDIKATEARNSSEVHDEIDEPVATKKVKGIYRTIHKIYIFLSLLYFYSMYAR